MDPNGLIAMIWSTSIGVRCLGVGSGEAIAADGTAGVVVPEGVDKAIGDPADNDWQDSRAGVAGVDRVAGVEDDGPGRGVEVREGAVRVRLGRGDCDAEAVGPAAEP